MHLHTSRKYKLFVTSAVSQAVPSRELQRGLNFHYAQARLCTPVKDARSLNEGRGLLSKHSSSSGTIFWIISNHVGKTTTILLPYE